MKLEQQRLGKNMFNGCFLISGLILLLIEQSAGTDVCKNPLIQLSDRKGTIVSPNYPNKYKPGSCQEWRIRSPPYYDSNSSITIRFLELNFGREQNVFTTDCTLGDYLVLGPVPEQTLCGMLNSSNEVYHSQRDHVWIKFMSQQSSDYTSDVPRFFKLQYIISGGSTEECKSEEHRCDSGKCIYSSWYCDGSAECEDYSDEKNCPDKPEVKSTPSPMTGMNNTYKGLAEGDPYLPFFKCGYNEFHCFVESQQMNTCLPIAKKCDGQKDCSDGSDEEIGEQCRYSKEGQKGWFSSPFFPNTYPNNLECSWRIHLTGRRESTIIQLRFITFSLPDNADSDSISVYDGPDDTYSLIGKYTSDNRPPTTINSKENWLYVTFTSDNLISWQGFNATYQEKGACIANQLSCGPSENECYDEERHCDGNWDCPVAGGDERGCGPCRQEDFSCGESILCYPLSERCTGSAKCQTQADEMNCDPIKCGPHNGTFLCENSFCIYEKWVCDGHNDCGDFSDERTCSGTSNRVIIAAIAGSIICALLLVILLGCSCKLYNLRLTERRGGPRHETPLSRLYAEISRRRPPPSYPEAMLHSRNYDEVRAEMEQIRRSADRRSRRHHRRSSSHNHHTNQGFNENTPNDVENPPTYEQSVGENSWLSSQNDNPNHSNIDRNSARDHLIQSQSDSEDSTFLDLDPIGQVEGYGITARNVVSGDNVSDEVCILQEGVSNTNNISHTRNNQADTCSIETASASMDGIDIPLPTISSPVKDSSSDSEDNNTIEEQPPKSDSAPKEGLRRGNSAESDNNSNSDVPLLTES